MPPPTVPRQTKSTHVRLDPLYHFFILPGLLVLLGWSIVTAVHNPNANTLWRVLLCLILPVMALKLRTYPLKAQDRLIRLEERLRLAATLSEPLRSRIGELSPSQLIALRFASDAELPPLVVRTLAENLNPKQIKQSIQDWRGDYFRV